MIDKSIVKEAVEEAIAGTDLFIVDIKVSADNRIVVEIDSPEYVDIDQCAAITRRIEERLDRDTEDYELEVGSAGLTSPFKVIEQYHKNLGNEVEVLTKDGRKLKGTLSDVSPDTFTITMRVKEKIEGKKKPVMVDKDETFAYDDAKSVTYLISFK